MTKTIDLEQIKDVLAQIRTNCPNPAIGMMFESLYEFMDLYNQRNRVKSNREEFDKKLHESYRILYQLVEKTSAEQGLDSNTLKRWLDDPAQILSSQSDCR